MVLRAPTRAPALPELRTGMRMTGEEFDRRYELRHDIKKAELVQGVVYVGSPVRIEEHAEPNGIVVAWTVNFAVVHREVQAATNGSVNLSPMDRVQPDAMLWKREGGNASVGEDRYLHGAPELVVEVTASTAKYDMRSKKDSYLRWGVLEYVVWLTAEDRILWFASENGHFVELTANADGWIESRVFPGLRLHPERLLDGDGTVVLPGAV